MSQPNTNKLVDIILVKYNAPDYERRCIESIIRYTPEPYNLTIIDNYLLDENLSTVWNRAIDNSNADIICLLNTDTIVGSNWLEPLIETLKEAELVGPVTNHCGTVQKSLTNTPKYKVRDCEISGFCMVFKKETWLSLDGFDEEFKLYGEDSDFVQRAIEKGLRSVCQQQSFVYHFGAKSSENITHKNIGEIRRESQRLHRDKRNSRRGRNG